MTRVGSTPYNLGGVLGGALAPTIAAALAAANGTVQSAGTSPARPR